MARLSGSRYISHLGPVCLAVIAVLCLDIVLAQDPFSDVLSPNTKLWKSFQEEMKTLEQAAHRVNKLITNANPPRAKEDQVAKASEKNPVAVTVLVSPDMLKNGIHTKPEESKVEEHENKKEEDSSSDLPIMSGVKQPNTLNLSSFMNAIGFFKTFPEPWWKGENVCVEKAVTEGRPKKGEKPKDKDGIIMGTGTFEHCKQTAGKYICKTVVTTPHLTKTFSTSYKCCEGYLRQANKCIPGEDNKLDHPAAESSSKDDNPEAEHLSHNNATPDKLYNTLKNTKSTEENSFSSQSEETNGQPRWLQNYFKGGWLKK